MPSPSYVPVVATGRPVTAATVTTTGDVTVGEDLAVAGDAAVTGGLDVDGYTTLQAGQADGQWTLWSGEKSSLRLGTAGGGIAIAEGADATSGVTTLTAGTAVVNTNKVAADTRIHLTVQSLGTVTTPQAVAVTDRTAGTSFTISSSDATDTSVVAWTMITPAA